MSEKLTCNALANYFRENKIASIPEIQYLYNEKYGVVREMFDKLVLSKRIRFIGGVSYERIEPHQEDAAKGKQPKKKEKDEKYYDNFLKWFEDDDNDDSGIDELF